MVFGKDRDGSKREPAFRQAGGRTKFGWGALEVTIGHVLEDALQPCRKLELWVWQEAAE